MTGERGRVHRSGNSAGGQLEMERGNKCKWYMETKLHRKRGKVFAPLTNWPNKKRTRKDVTGYQRAGVTLLTAASNKQGTAIEGTDVAVAGA